MLRHAIYSFVFVLSFTAAQADENKTYFGVTAIVDAELNYDHPDLYDINSDAGYILSVGRQLQDNLAFEFAYIQYAKASTSPAAASAELSALEASVIFSTSQGGAFARLGFSDGDAKSRVLDSHSSESESGLLYGVGFNIPMPMNSGMVRVEYNVVDYDNADANRLSLGTVFRF